MTSKLITIFSPIRTEVNYEKRKKKKKKETVAKKKKKNRACMRGPCGPEVHAGNAAP